MASTHPIKSHTNRRQQNPTGNGTYSSTKVLYTMTVTKIRQGGGSTIHRISPLHHRWRTVHQQNTVLLYFGFIRYFKPLIYVTTDYDVSSSVFLRSATKQKKMYREHLISHCILKPLFSIPKLKINFTASYTLKKFSYA
jgi:hypothetical protein